jgi:hypothetical protein
MVWYNDVHFIEWDVITFLVAEKESAMNIHKQLRKVYGVNTVDKALLVTGLHTLQVLRKAKQSSVTCITLAGHQQQSLICCFNILMNSFEMTDALQPESS